MFLPFFWALFDQMNTTWITQMKKLDNDFTLFGYAITVLPSQLQSFNPIYIVVLAPLFSKYLYPRVNWTSLQKMNIGFCIGAFSFAIIGLVELMLESGEKPSFFYQAFSCLMLTLAEILVSITVLEYAYRNAPKVMKSFVMGLFYFSMFIGNLLIVGVLSLVRSVSFVKEILEGANQFFFFAGLIGVVSVIFYYVRRFYLEIKISK